MHIHGNQISLNAANPYSAAADRAAAAQRAADVRKKLMKSSTATEGSANPEEASMVSHWNGLTQSDGQNDVEFHTAAAGKDSDFG